MQERRKNSERSEETRTALLTTGRSLFVEKGFVDTGTPEVVKRAGVTRGALYHHFEDKLALFRAVIEREASQIAKEIEAGSSNESTPIAALNKGADVYLDVMRDPGRVRLILVDGPAILGAAAMREIDLRAGGLELRKGISEISGANAAPEDVAVVADLISAMFERAVLVRDAGADEARYLAAIKRLLARII